MEADIIFHFAGADNSTGRLSLEDFAKILDPRWKIPEQLPSEVKPEDVSAKKRGFGWDVIESAYAFTLGAIAGAVGATAVYPIDLVKTRMQNQRSKVVGELLYKNSIDCFKKVVRNEGFAGLYRGLGPQLVVSKSPCDIDFREKPNISQMIFLYRVLRQRRLSN
jgi:solute carrier family 25 aspartate/glutamate transporter 12/13